LLVAPFAKIQGSHTRADTRGSRRVLGGFTCRMGISRLSSTASPRCSRKNQCGGRGASLAPRPRERSAPVPGLPHSSLTIRPFTQSLSRKTKESYTLGAISDKTCDPACLAIHPCGISCKVAPHRRLPCRSRMFTASSVAQSTPVRARNLLQSHPRRSTIWDHGDTGCSPSFGSQTRKSQLGTSDSARSRARYRIRTAGQATATHARDVCLVA
jgi:Fe-S-cluster containining protein